MRTNKSIRVPTWPLWLAMIVTILMAAGSQQQCTAPEPAVSAVFQADDLSPEAHRLRAAVQAAQRGGR